MKADMVHYIKTIKTFVLMNNIIYYIDNIYFK